MHIEPYLFFDGRCEEALDFYSRVLGAKVEMMMRYKDCPEKPAGEMANIPSEKIMHASIRVGDATIMASDGRSGGKPKFDGFALSIEAANEKEADKVFAALSDGGKVAMPLAKTFFSPRFGMVADKFGVSWMVIVRQPM